MKNSFIQGLVCAGAVDGHSLRGVPFGTRKASRVGNLQICKALVCAANAVGRDVDAAVIRIFQFGRGGIVDRRVLVDQRVAGYLQVEELLRLHRGAGEQHEGGEKYSEK